MGEVHLLAAHCVQVDNEDIELLRDSSVFVSHNPASNLKLGNGIAPVQEMLDNGIVVTIGTDGSSSNNTLNVWGEARLASLLQKRLNPRNMDKRTVIKMLTEDGYISLGMSGGRIEPGYDADLTIINIDEEFLPEDYFLSHIVHSAGEKVFATMVDGKFIYYDGKYPTIDVDEVMKMFRKSYRRLIDE